MKWLNVRLTNLSYSNHVRGYPLYPAYRLGPFQSHAAPGSPQGREFFAIRPSMPGRREAA